MPARLTVLSGPSGVGKGTVMAAVRRINPDVWLSVSATTRMPRPGERDGVHYDFVSPAQFATMVERGELLEYAQFADNYYGTPRAAVLDKLATGVPVLLEIELQGARQVRNAMPDAQFVFLAPPSIDELTRRLSGRATENPAALAARLARAEIEMAATSEFDTVIVNDDVERAARELVSLLAAAPPIG
jgi:guanylate kinase